MSRSFTGSTSNYLETTNDESFYTINDRTVLVYVKASSLPSANATIFWGGSDSASDVYGTISLNSSNAIRGTARNGSTDEVVTTETLATDTWVPLVCRFTLDSGEFLMSGADWAKRATGTTDETFAASGDSRMALGCNRDTTPSDPFTGLIAHLAVWDAKLSDSDIESLVGGADPTTIAVADRFAYWPLTDSSLTDVWSGSSYELSVGGTVNTDADNPTFGGGGGGGSPDVYFVGGAVNIELPLPVVSGVGTSARVVEATGAITVPMPRVYGVFGVNGVFASGSTISDNRGRRLRGTLRRR